MSCVPCEKARSAMVRGVREAAGGNLRAAAAQVPKVVGALGEKAEAVRVRTRLALRKVAGQRER
jgi:hypothetical protein